MESRLWDRGVLRGFVEASVFNGAGKGFCNVFYVARDTEYKGGLTQDSYLA